MTRLPRLSALAMIAFVVAIYAYFFLLGEQHWSLVDDYRIVLAAKAPGFSLWNHFVTFDRYEMHTGRFKPLTDFMVAARLALLPLTPRAFHVYQFFLSGGVFVSFYLLMRKLGLSALRATIGLFVAIFAYPVKDMIVTSVASETMMLLFFFIAFLSFVSGRLVLSFVSIVLMLLTKETSLALLACFPAYFLALRRRPGKTESAYIASFSLVAFFIALRIVAAPHTYTSKYTLTNLNLPSFARELFLPPFQNFWPVFAVLGAWIVLSRPRPSGLSRNPALLVGGMIVLAFTAAMAPWLPFDHWWYLHLPIPFGWALIVASLWPEPSSRKSAAIQTVAIGVLGMWAARVAIIGSANYQTYLSEAKRIAEIVCTEARGTPGLRYYSNCDEAAKQLLNYLRLERGCDLSVDAQPVSGESTLQAPYLYVNSSRCGAGVSMKAAPIASLRFWSAYRDPSR